MIELTSSVCIGASVLASIVGILTGIFGVGGGFLLTPALMVLLGFPGNVAVGTSLPIIFVNSSYGLFKRRKTKTVDYKLALIIATGSVVGVLVGVGLINKLESMDTITVLGKEQQPVQFVLLWLFILLLMWIASFLTYDLFRQTDNSSDGRAGYLSKVPLAPYMKFESLSTPEISLVSIIAVGCMIGLLTGLLGVGGGVVMLPALVYLVGQRTGTAAGTSLLIVWISSSIGSIGHIMNGNVQLLLFVIMTVFGLIGTNIGTKIGLKMAGRSIRFYFVLIVIAAIVMVAYEAVDLTF